MTIRIAHLSDSHFDERGRLQDIIDVHRAFLGQAKEADVDLIVHAGDWFERRSTPAERLAVADFLEEAMHVAPVFGVKGNHDAELDLSLFPRLDLGGDGVVILDRPTAVPGTAKTYRLGDHRYFGRLTGERVAGVKLGLLALPWFDKAHLVADLTATVDSERSRALTIAAAQDLLRGIGAEAARLRKEGTIPILVGHVLVAGSEVSTGQTLIGTTVELAPGDLYDVNAAYVALGHVHKTQGWFHGQVAYSGSPHRCNFGESEAKGWRLVTLTDEGQFVSNEFVELPARRIVLLESDWASEEGARKLREVGIEPTCFALSHCDEVKKALVRFRYRIRPEDLHLVQDEVLERIFLADGAAEVKLEAIVAHEARARAPEIVETRTTAEKVDAYFRAKSIDVDEEQRGRLEHKLAELEGGGHAAA